MTARTRAAWRNAGAGAVCLVLIAGLGTLGYRATYHVFPGMMPTVVHWCGRDYEAEGMENWAQVTAAERPRQVRAVGSYPSIFGRPLLAAPVAGPVRPGEPCAMGVYLRTVHQVPGGEHPGRRGRQRGIHDRPPGSRVHVHPSRAGQLVVGNPVAGEHQQVARDEPGLPG